MSPNRRPVTRVLIANRGEIALRILRACRQLGIDAVVAYSEADRESRAVLVADEAICIGPADAKQSYLSAPAVISAALATCCDAIHPGYGFLSENAAFAEAAAAHGLTFIGASAAVLERFESKAGVRALLAKHGLPTSVAERVKQGMYLVSIGNTATSVAKALSVPERRIWEAL